MLAEIAEPERLLVAGLAATVAGLSIPSLQSNRLEGLVLESITSSPRPIRPWFVGESVLEDGARLGFVYAPGRRLPGAVAPDWRRDLDADLRALRVDQGADVLVSLMEAEEMSAMGIGELPRRAKAHGLEWIGFPIPDMGVPEDRSAYAELLECLERHLAAGRIVVLHCLGGLGRSGMVAASVLVRRGMSPDDAIREVRRSRPGAVQTVAQELLVRELDGSER